MPSEADIILALDRLRHLDQLAQAGWPDGYDAEAVGSEARRYVGVLTQAVAEAPSSGQTLLARGLVASLNNVIVLKASVTSKRKGVK